MIPTVFAAAYSVMPRSRQASTTVMIGLVATLAPTIGPSLGGWLTETLSWHWLFLVNLAPGVLVTLAVAVLIDVDKPQLELIRRLDVLGLVLMALFLGCLDFVLEDGSRNDWFEDETILICAVISAVAGVGFFWRTLTAENPIVDLRAFADRNFATGCLFSFILGIALYGLVYLQPQFLARVRGLNALQIGGVMLVTGASQFLSAPVVGAISRKVDPRILLCVGFSLLATSNFLLTDVTADWDFNEFVLPQILRGTGFMFTIIPANVLSLGTLPPERLKNASGLYNLMRNLGGAFGLAGITTLLDKRGALHWARIGEHIDPTRPEIQAALRDLTAHFSRVPGLDASAAAKTLGKMVYKQATVMSFLDVFWIMAWISAAAIGVVLLAHKPKQMASGGGALKMTDRRDDCPGSLPACRGRRPDPGKREAILAAAVRLFLAHGYGVSVETIAAEAGVSKQTIYNLFSTKERLFGAVVADHSRIVVAAIENAADDADPRAVLTAVAHELLHLLTGERVAKIYRMLMSAVIESGGKSELPAQFYDNGPARGTRQLAAYLARQEQLGRLAVPDPAQAAECFFGMLNGHILIRNMMGLQSRWDEDALRRRAETCVAAFLETHRVTAADP